jgi:DNA-binding transcriptional regulator YdaS (Cro superfamily)
MSHRSAVQRALDKFDGSPTKMAVAIGGDVKRQHIEHWLKAGRVPAEHCPAVKDLTGVQLWELRPDDWHRIWPMVIGAKGAPKVPAEASGKAHGAERAAAAVTAARRLRRSRNPDRSNAHKER